MSQQKTIKAFFQSSPVIRTIKRSISDLENVDSINITKNDKKLKSGKEEESCPAEGTESSLAESNVNEKLKNTTVDEKEETVSKIEINNITVDKKEETASKIEINNITVDEKEETASKIETNKLNAELKLLSKRLVALNPNIGLTWFKALQNEFSRPYFKKLSKFLEEERSKTTPVFPRPEQVWTWTRECQVDEVKVVILGQDPYHHPGQAHGLSFSVPVGIPPPPSLLNMYKELENDINGFKRPGHGYLIGWARQGVLLLNAVLTVKCRTPNSHKDQGWEKLTDAVIKHLNTEGDGIVFLLWGSYAQKKAEFVNQKKHHLLKSVHPSPLSASRGFFGCKHFSKCNHLLVSQGKKPIDWSCLPTE